MWKNFKVLINYCFFLVQSEIVDIKKPFEIIRHTLLSSSNSKKIYWVSWSLEYGGWEKKCTLIHNFNDE